MLTQQRLKEVLVYSPDSGVFLRDGKVAGTIYKGRVNIFIDYRGYLAHRLAWFYVHGSWPVGDIDHIDGNASNNAIANLRDVSRSVNMQNQRRARSDSKTGVLGVSRRDNGKYRAEIALPSGRVNLGTFDTSEAAHAAYLIAKRMWHEGCAI